MSWEQMTKDERTKFVRHHIEVELWTYSKIAAYFGVSRSAIAGVCNRNNIKVPDFAPQKAASTRKAAMLKLRAVKNNVVPFPLISQPDREEAVSEMVKKAKEGLKAKRLSSVQASVAWVLNTRASDNRQSEEAVKVSRFLSPDKWSPLPGVDPVGIMALANHHCRWPVGDKLYCGANKKDSHAYCERHCEVAFRPHTEVAPKKTQEAPPRINFG
jgi:hypothetical protein